MSFEGKISWSELKQYQTCPYQFFLKNINIADLSMVNRKAKQHGLGFHKFCELYHDKYDEPDMEKTFKDPRMQQFHEFEIKRYEWCKENKLPWKPLYREKTFETDDWVCVVDRIDDMGDGTVMVVEYKNKPFTMDKQQLAFEHHVLTENGLKISKFAIIYAEHPEDNYYKTPNKGSLNSMKKKMSVALMGIRGGYFPAKSGFPCFYCDFGKLGQCNKIGVTLNLCLKCSIPLEIIENP